MSKSNVVLTNVTDQYINGIEIDDESFTILKSIVRGLKLVYTHYKCEITNPMNPNTINAKQLSKPLLSFLRDFEVCPYILNQKTSFLVWYYTGLSPYESISVHTRAKLFSITATLSMSEDKLF